MCLGLQVPNCITEIKYYLESLDHATSLIPSLWPEIVFSNLPSYAPQILINLSADELASHSPLGLKMTKV